VLYSIEGTEDKPLKIWQNLNTVLGNGNNEWNLNA
jgi:hypothetical protein